MPQNITFCVTSCCLSKPLLVLSVVLTVVTLPLLVKWSALLLRVVIPLLVKPLPYHRLVIIVPLRLLF